MRRCLKENYRRNRKENGLLTVIISNFFSFSHFDVDSLCIYVYVHIKGWRDWKCRRKASSSRSGVCGKRSLRVKLAAPGRKCPGDSGIRRQPASDYIGPNHFTQNLFYLLCILALADVPFFFTFWLSFANFFLVLFLQNIFLFFKSLPPFPFYIHSLFLFELLPTSYQSLSFRIGTWVSCNANESQSHGVNLLFFLYNGNRWTIVLYNPYLYISIWSYVHGGSRAQQGSIRARGKPLYQNSDTFNFNSSRLFSNGHPSMIANYNIYTVCA